MNYREEKDSMGQLNVPENALVVSFGGEPNPHDYPTSWINDYW